jgi:hypothetical protein
VSFKVETTVFVSKIRLVVVKTYSDVNSRLS